MEFAKRQKQQKRTRKQEDLRVVAVEFSPALGVENGLGKVYDLLLLPRQHEDGTKILRGEE